MSIVEAIWSHLISPSFASFAIHELLETTIQISLDTNTYTFPCVRTHLIFSHINISKSTWVECSVLKKVQFLQDSGTLLF